LRKTGEWHIVQVPEWFDVEVIEYEGKLWFSRNCAMKYHYGTDDIKNKKNKEFVPSALKKCARFGVE